MTLNINSIITFKVALKPIPKPRSIRILKFRIIIKFKPAEVTKYKDKTTKLYTSRTYNIKAPVIRNRRGTKSKNKLSKVIIFISGRESSSSNNTSIKDNNKDKLIKV